MIFKKIVVFGVLLVLLILGARSYLGFHYLYKYKGLRSQARSIEESFNQLETNLKKAIGFYENPLFYKEISRLYFEMALAENQFGTEERRELFLDKARDSLISRIKINPIDAFAHYDMGKVFLLYNFPLLTYMDKGKLYFRRALELKPADEFLNVNIVFIYMTQWESLEEEEVIYIKERIQIAKKASENFSPMLRKRWRENVGDEKKLGEILEEVEGTK